MNLIKKVLLVTADFIYDYLNFIIHSSIFVINTENKIEGKIGFYYHSIEKGLINTPIRFNFGKVKIKKLIELLNLWLKKKFDTENSQFIAACSVLIKYYELHNSNKINLSEIISSTEIDRFKTYAKISLGGTIEFRDKDYFKFAESNFDLFSNSRHSVRHFNSKEINLHDLIKVMDIAKNYPSVCNRQSVRVKIVNNKDVTKEVLKLQNGLNTTAETVNQLLVVTSNINYFLSEAERNQLFIDGGIFLQNLLYSLHFNKISACALNWSKHFFQEMKIKRMLRLDKAERIIALVAIGYPKESFKVPFSNRRNIDEIIKVIE
ncbi:MAG: nitroreductase family protein [Ignavibacteria bacterium]|jgi:nitroreductase